MNRSLLHFSGLLMGWLSVLALAACTQVATIALVSPADGEIVCGDVLYIETVVENFELEGDHAARLASAEPAHGDEESGGHVHVYLNGEEIFQGDTAVFEAPGPWPEGEHQLKVELVHGDHTVVDPYAGDFHYITIDNTVCETSAQ